MVKCPYCGSSRYRFLGQEMIEYLNVPANLYECKDCQRVFATVKLDNKVLKLKAKELPICEVVDSKPYCVTYDLLMKNATKYRFLGIYFFFTKRYLLYLLDYRFEKYDDLFLAFYVDNYKLIRFELNK
ncbi:hypothetical protein [Caldisphaera sp.]|uniref:hypothetical protein n=1 Tax=Caldisphaera sp. TaxID=2060322 RepID=UPI0025BE1FDA|nr:hypothetical protein [Caldisphaera sp.]